jgi:DNA modification methylase
MVVDAIKDCTSRRDLVLDSFLGSGTTLLAAERVGRRCIGVEIEPRFVDLTIRRWQQLTGKDAIHAESGLRFEVIVNERAPNHDGR